MEIFAPLIGAALIGLFFYSAISLSRAERRLKEVGVPLAVEIAKLKGWVSPYRLMAQSQMKKAQAEIILRDACRRGLLQRQADGRYYAP
jgi:ribosomal protein S25